MSQPAKTLENNIDGNDEKCPEMSQLMEDTVQPQPLEGLNSASFPELTDLQGFQGENSEGFSTVLTEKHGLKRRNMPSYRIINKNLKSKKQYWKERNRRKEVLRLSGEWLTYPQIAKKLGISTKTVQRDMKKIAPYQKGILLRHLRELEEKRILKFEKLMGHMTLNQRFRALTNMIIKQRKQRRGREYRKHLVKVFINMDDAIQGIPRITHWPNTKHFKLTMPMRMQFFVVIKGMKLYMGMWELS